MRPNVGVAEATKRYQKALLDYKKASDLKLHYTKEENSLGAVLKTRREDMLREIEIEALK